MFYVITGFISKAGAGPLSRNITSIVLIFDFDLSRSLDLKYPECATGVLENNIVVAVEVFTS